MDLMKGNCYYLIKNQSDLFATHKNWRYEDIGSILTVLDQFRKK